MTYLRVFLFSILIAALAGLMPSVVVAVLTMVMVYYLVAGITDIALLEPATYMLVALLAAFVF